MDSRSDCLLMQPQNNANPRTIGSVPFFGPKFEVFNHLKSAVADHPETTWTAIISGPLFDWVS
jgi:hypothetical protein